jgi:streptogramin lyase
MTARVAAMVVAGAAGALVAVALIPAAAPADGTYAVNTFSLPSGYTFPQDGSVPEITPGPNNALWFGLDQGSLGYIGELPTNATPGSAVQTTYAIPSLNDPDALTLGPDGNVWFTEEGADVGQITSSGAIQETAVAPLDGITTGSDGNLWAADNGAELIKIPPGDPRAYAPTPLSGMVEPDGIASGPNNTVWYTTDAQGTWSASVTDPAHPTNVAASGSPGGNSDSGIVEGPDGNMWVAEGFGSGAGNANAIAKITPAGQVTEYTIPTADSVPDDITVGSDGALWFTEEAGDKIGRITTSGQITEITLPSGATPQSIASGPDGNIWFTEAGNGSSVAPAIGEVVIPQTTATTTTTTTTTGTTPTSTATASTPPPPRATAGAVKTSGDRATVSITCHGVGGQRCSATATLTTIEHLSAKGGKLTAVSARARKAKTKRVVVGSSSFTLPAGKTKTMTVTLTRTGKSLLDRFKRLPASLAVRSAGKQIKTDSVTFEAPKPKRHK